MSLERRIRMVADWVGAVHSESAGDRLSEMLSLNTLRDEGAILMAREDVVDAARVALHESAHCVVGHRWGLRIRRAVVRADGSGATEYVTIEDDDELLVSRCVANLAGIAAELVHADPDGNRQFVLRHSADVLSAALNIARARQRGAQFGVEVFARMTFTTVIANWQTILRVAEALRSAGELDGGEIAALCRQPI